MSPVAGSKLAQSAAPPALPDLCEPLGDEAELALDRERMSGAERPVPPTRLTRSAAPSTAPAAADMTTLYREHHRMVFHLGLRYGRGDVAWAEDVTQEVFLDLFRALANQRLCDLDDLSGWLYRATSNRCLNRLRRDRFLALAPMRWLLGEQQREPEIPETLAIAREDVRRVFDALGALPPKEQIAFAMYYLDGKEQEEIGRTLGHSKSYVCKLIQRAVDRVQTLGLKGGGRP